MVETAEARRHRLRRRRANHPGWSTAKNRAWEERNPEKRAAHKTVEKALRSGVLVRKPCERCGVAAVQAHHADYSHPLDVMWLCAKHHRAEHVQSHREFIVS